MRAAFIALGIVGLLASSSTALPALGANETNNVAVVQRMLTALEATDPNPSALADLFSDDCYIRWSEKDTPATGKTAAIAKLASLFSKNHRYKIVVHQWFAKGPIVVTSRDDITLSNGKAAAPFHVVGVFVVENGKIARWDDYEDR
jgi:limonene-1,2-epoxide hydrolase